MNKILNWFKFWETKEQPYVKPQKFVDLKRTNSIVSFIHPVSYTHLRAPPCRSHQPPSAYDL